MRNPNLLLNLRVVLTTFAAWAIWGSFSPVLGEEASLDYTLSVRNQQLR